MQKNWYAVYTKPNCEKKVALLLTKKRIQNFCPINTIEIKSFRRSKLFHEPLFKSYIFVNISESDIPMVKQIDGIISLLYWMGNPAIIGRNEIETIKEFSSTYQNIELEKTLVNKSDMLRIIDAPAYTIDGNLLALKNKKIKIYLPSLGYIMIAKMKDESVFGRVTTILQNNSFSHS